MKETDYAYLAGLIDADGNYSWIWRNSHMHVTVQMCHEATIDYLVETFGGKKYFNRKNDNHPTHKPVFIWRAGAVWMREHLPHMIQFHVTKKDRAQIMLDALAIRRRNYSGSLEEQLILHTKLTALNKRGKIPA